MLLQATSSQRKSAASAPHVCCGAPCVCAHEKASVKQQARVHVACSCVAFNFSSELVRTLVRCVLLHCALFLGCTSAPVHMQVQSQTAHACACTSKHAQHMHTRAHGRTSTITVHGREWKCKHNCATHKCARVRAITSTHTTST